MILFIRMNHNVYTVKTAQTKFTILFRVCEHEKINLWYSFESETQNIEPDLLRDNIL